MASNLDKFNQIHPEKELSRPGTAGNDLFTESSKVSEIADIYRTRPSTAVNKDKPPRINFLGNILTRSGTPNTIHPLNDLDEEPEKTTNENGKDSDEGFNDNERQITTTREIEERQNLRARLATINAQENDDVLYLVTHENIEYIQLNTARGHVTTLIGEIQKLRNRHVKQVQVLRAKLVNTAKFAKSLQDLPKTAVEIPTDLSGEVNTLKRELVAIQHGAHVKEKKLKKKIKELNAVIEALKTAAANSGGAGVSEDELKELIETAKTEAKKSKKSTPEPVGSLGLPKRSKSFVRDAKPGVEDILEEDEDVGDDEDYDDDDDDDLTVITARYTPGISSDREAELLKLLKEEQEKVQNLEDQLELDNDDEDEADQEATGPAIPQKGSKLSKTFAKLTATSGGTLSVGDQKKLKQIEKKLDLEAKKFQREKNRAEKAEKELQDLQKDLKYANKEISKLEAELKSLGSAAVEGRNAIIKAQQLETDIKDIKKSNIDLEASFVKERKLRRQYYNELEDMKGKIRVFARVRPMVRYEKEKNCAIAVIQQDEMTMSVKTNRFGTKEFTFNRVFMPEDSQEEVFEDTNRLIQSAIDGFNVCIFAYGQTGSGKTYTMIGEKPDRLGLAPRAFERVFELLEENKKKFTYKVKMYMLELYCDKLRDLMAPKGGADAPMEIKKDKLGMVFVQGCTIIDVQNAEELERVFDAGNSTRKTSKTNMNDASSRSHLVVSLLMESVNRETGNVVSGKLSLVDLAGSERVAKTGANAQQQKEANSINQSLSALGNVIAGLVEGEKFIRYRDNKLTQLMQDSLGGNAKTLMFVNVSPTDYNADETANSLVYASRVKHITNDAQKNAESKEVARLKEIIFRLKGGEEVSNDEVQHGKAEDAR